MSALLVKDTPEGLHQWLKSEASFNRRSLNQQVLICLEWCMRTYGKAQLRNPFASARVEQNEIAEGPRKRLSAQSRSRPYLHGRDLAVRLMSIEPIDAATAKQMGKDACVIRKKKIREFDYACFA